MQPQRRWRSTAHLLLQAKAMTHAPHAPMVVARAARAEDVAVSAEVSAVKAVANAAQPAMAHRQTARPAPTPSAAMMSKTCRAHPLRKTVQRAAATSRRPPLWQVRHLVPSKLRAPTLAASTPRPMATLKAIPMALRVKTQVAVSVVPVTAMAATAVTVVVTVPMRVSPRTTRQKRQRLPMLTRPPRPPQWQRARCLTWPRLPLLRSLRLPLLWSRLLLR